MIGERIVTSRSGGQLAYYSNSALRRSRLRHRAELMGHGCIGLGVALTSTALACNNAVYS